MSKFILKATYYWKELTADGLLKEPKRFGPYYSEVAVNNYGSGYDSEEEANTDLLSKPEFEYYRLVLIKEVRVIDPDWI